MSTGVRQAAPKRLLGASNALAHPLATHWFPRNTSPERGPVFKVLTDANRIKSSRITTQDMVEVASFYRQTPPGAGHSFLATTTNGVFSNKHQRRF
eukprot:350521-Chlamydomonas_euryale.AAC.3